MINEDLKASIGKGATGIAAAWISYANIQAIATIAGIVVSVLMAFSLGFDIVRKWKDRNTPTRDLQREDED